MARPLSDDLRERMVAAVRAGSSCRAVAARFDVAPSSVVKVAQRARRTGSVSPGKMGGHRRPKLEPYRDVLLAALRERPETTLHEMQQLLAAGTGCESRTTPCGACLARRGLELQKEPAGQRG